MIIKNFYKNKLALIFGSISLTLFAINISLGVFISAKGVEVMAIENEISDLKAQNREINTSIMLSRSLENVSNNLQSMKMVKPSYVLYLNKENSIANR